MNKVVLYIHGKNGSPDESEHYRPLFQDSDVIGLDYKSFTPWDTGKEIHSKVEILKNKYSEIILIANSIGAFFSLNADLNNQLSKAYFISPIVDMEELIIRMMSWANVSEEQLEKEKIIHTDFGEDLSWDYLSYVREHSIKWNIPTHMLYGSQDNIVSEDSLKAFAKQNNSSLTVMKNGEHWFHTEEQLKFLDDWIRTHR